ncbi:hypothetical protein MROS_1117 [Melioribacter roseus P3M-2]|uniref:Uncharacterized protein n=1 Tax=Melioribacter roseus (strain DSM 23840 / JCM 17771 / VKM B-2668 / P3M-2) TaxID=1191523 RepID=I7A353_MELRP|nr:hypothetical protein [Melioribacter roseus]AFN74356.1 hypothetical protein MROS_1117 [Melioribacter roseus P3M-2]
MKNKFSPSINIIRDKGKEFSYIPTSNAERVLHNLDESILHGIRSFYIVGSFGTGKSSFLLAFEQQIENGKRIFSTPLNFNGRTKYKTLNIIGDYRSFEETLREILKISQKVDIIEGLEKYYKKIAASNMGLLIVIDEFGKFLEYASENKPEQELYAIQKLAEFVNNQNKNIILLTTLHQGFDAYRVKSDEKIRNEWEKVKGRLKEIPFNEPVEQLLYLAARYLNGNPTNISNEEYKELYTSIIKARVYPLYNTLNEFIAKKLFPLEILSAGIIAKALQRYGQNERSLFTFLETTDFSSYIKKNKKYFNLVDVYDYLLNNFYSFLSSKYNPDYLKWSIIKSTLERVEIIFEKNFIEKSKIIKTIGLLNIFAPSGAKINAEFLKVYGNLSLNIENIEEEIKLLEKHKLIRFQSYSQCYVLFEGTDVDIDLALNEAENYINPNPDLVGKLKEFFDTQFLPAKASYLKTGTPRFFEIVISDYPIKQLQKGEADGIINLIFNENLHISTIKNISKSTNEVILYGYYENADKIRTNILEIEKANYVLEKYADDRVVKREIKNLIENLTIEINELVIDSLFYKDSKVRWIYNGSPLNIDSKTTFNKKLSEIIDKSYSKTPIFHNELINREKLPGAINTARKALFNRLFEHWDKEDLLFDKKQYPPEKTIYLSLLKNTGIHRKENGLFILTAPKEKSFIPLWQCCEEFLESSKATKKSLADLFEKLQEKPFKLKSGFIAFWVPIYLFIKRDEYALFDGDVFLPELSLDLFEMILKNPHNYFIKTFNVKGIRLELFNRYQELINRASEEKITTKSFVDTIKPFLSFYRGLTEYSQKTLRLSKETLLLRDAIAKAKDPEKTFFEDFPNALGFTSQELLNSNEKLDLYVNKLKNSIRELRLSYDELLNRIEKTLKTSTGFNNLEFPDYKDKIILRYASIKTYLFLPHQRTIYQRINSNLNDRKTWLSSFVQGLIGKSLEVISDDEEKIIHEKIKTIFHEFDNLTDIANLGIDNNKEIAISVEITSTDENTHRALIRLSKEQEKLAEEIEKKIIKNLSSDKKLNQIALLKLLKKQLNNNSKE